MGFMARAIQEAQLAQQEGEVPVGAVVVRDNKVIAACGNQTIRLNDPTAHAEINAIRQASALLSTRFLLGCDLYVTLEPCPMCAQAISFARMRCLYFGAYDVKGGALFHGPRLYTQPTCFHKPTVIGGVQESACRSLLKAFFYIRRESFKGPARLD